MSTQTTSNLMRGRVLHDHSARYPNGRGIVLAVRGTYDPSKQQTLGGGVVVIVDPNNNGEVDIAWPESTRPHIAKGTPQSIVCRRPYHIADELASEEEIAAALASIEAAQQAAKRAAEEKVHRQATEREILLRQYSKLLTPASKSAGVSDYALGAKNVKIELAAAFPGHKFSVRSEGYSGGCSINVRWSLGPTEEQVKGITSKYQEGHFNGMEDIYESDTDNQWPDLFGGAKHVFANREFGEASTLIAATLCDLWQIEKPADGRYWNVYRKDDCCGRNLVSHALEILGADAYPPGAVITGVESLQESRSGIGWSSHYRATYTAPAAAVAAVVAEAEAVASFEGKPSVRFNEDKNGIELVFPAKPAEAVLSTLKRHGWRWSRFSSCWYHRASDESLNAAAQAANLTPEQVAVLKQKIDSAHHAAGARGMEIACGIA